MAKEVAGALCPRISGLLLAAHQILLTKKHRVQHDWVPVWTCSPPGPGSNSRGTGPGLAVKQPEGPGGTKLGGTEGAGRARGGRLRGGSALRSRRRPRLLPRSKMEALSRAGQEMSLAALKQHDPYITSIADVTGQVALYSFSPKANEWVRAGPGPRRARPARGPAPAAWGSGGSPGPTRRGPSSRGKQPFPRVPAPPARAAAAADSRGAGGRGKALETRVSAGADAPPRKVERRNSRCPLRFPSRNERCELALRVSAEVTEVPVRGWSWRACASSFPDPHPPLPTSAEASVASYTRVLS